MSKENKEEPYEDGKCEDCVYERAHSNLCGGCGDVSEFTHKDIVSSCENCDKLQSENDHLGDLVDAVRQELYDYKKVFKNDDKLKLESKVYELRANELQAQLHALRWISVSEGLPKVRTRKVFVVTNTNLIDTDYYVIKHKCWETRRLTSHVVKWMEVPKI